MMYDRVSDTVMLDAEALEENDVTGLPDPDLIRPFNAEDLDHLRDVILEMQETTGATALPGIESVYHQIALRLRAQN